MNLFVVISLYLLFVTSKFEHNCSFIHCYSADMFKFSRQWRGKRRRMVESVI